MYQVSQVPAINSAAIHISMLSRRGVCSWRWEYAGFIGAPEQSSRSIERNPEPRPGPETSTRCERRCGGAGQASQVPACRVDVRSGRSDRTGQAVLRRASTLEEQLAVLSSKWKTR